MKSIALVFFLLRGAELRHGGGVNKAPRRTRQGDYLHRLRWSPPWSESTMENTAVSTTKTDRRGASPPPAAVRSKEADRVERLPGQPAASVGEFPQYAGYVTVHAAAGRALFYYLAEPVGTGNGSSGSKPLLLWLNGGPGCSSLGYGAMQELGLFRVMSDGKTLYRNPYSWNHAANVLFMESPAGVGYSYSNTTLDYSQSGDNKTAEDAYLFLTNWMERFPEYKGRDFYVTGESYAGHYVPQLAHQILRHKPPSINLKGIMIGNAVINDWTDKKGMYDFYWTHALISDDTADAITKNCNFTAATEEPGDINIYNIYAPMCQSRKLVSPPITPSIESFDPCTDHYVEAYLNDPDVQKALHANVTRLNHPCVRFGYWVDSAPTVLPIIRELMKNNIRVWVYSGDTDGRVPVTSTRYSLNQLQLPVAEKWRPWFSSTKGNGEVGGYVVQYKGDLSLVTVRGAGHEVPSYQPQ
ncbi:hypothetical protein BRADI_1g19170v3 [Brachypodium distachyon]|uniref:Carboxypeptidase n=1 Tax=Brachypodium distachyon TaxID=15368 RepID=A0A0Q3JS61_BRADI|nr:hypothetical protein BRADI_1g19170v3 [Brachypodium distachyon]